MIYNYKVYILGSIDVSHVNISSLNRLSSLVSPPSVVRNISWVENVWPEAANDDRWFSYFLIFVFYL